MPVPPTSTTLRLASRNAPVVSSRTNASLTGLAEKSKSVSSLAIGSFAIVIWYLIERAFLSAISAVSSSPMICCTGWRRLSPWATISSNAARIPESLSVLIISSTSGRSMAGLPQAVVALAVGHRRMTKAQALRRLDRRRRLGITTSCEEVEHHISAARATLERFGARLLHRLQAVVQYRGEHGDELPVAVAAPSQPRAHPFQRSR